MSRKTKPPATPEVSSEPSVDPSAMSELEDLFTDAFAQEKSAADKSDIPLRVGNTPALVTQEDLENEFAQSAANLVADPQILETLEAVLENMETGQSLLEKRIEKVDKDIAASLDVVRSTVLVELENLSQALQKLATRVEEIGQRQSTMQDWLIEVLSREDEEEEGGIDHQASASPPKVDMKAQAPSQAKIVTPAESAPAPVDVKLKAIIEMTAPKAVTNGIGLSDYKTRLLAHMASGKLPFTEDDLMQGLRSLGYLSADGELQTPTA